MMDDASSDADPDGHTSSMNYFRHWKNHLMSSDGKVPDHHIQVSGMPSLRIEGVGSFSTEPLHALFKMTTSLLHP